jgi:hypothetical protein
MLSLQSMDHVLELPIPSLYSYLFDGWRRELDVYGAHESFIEAGLRRILMDMESKTLLTGFTDNPKNQSVFNIKFNF